MSIASNEAFFKEKRQWSEIKDALLKCYLKPYMNKILVHGGPVRYIDCFAGAGIFEDGKEGSPLIAIKEIREAIASSHAWKKDVKLSFIEKVHSNELISALSSERDIVDEVIRGCFEDTLIPWAKRNQNSNLFCYIDPFGVKVLDYHILEQLTSLDFDTMEFLINFNAFGFFRWACAHEKITVDSRTIDDYSELGDEDSPDDARDEALNNVLGCEKWKEIVAIYNKDKTLDPLAGRKAVDAIAVLYWRLLKSKFPFVLNIPICIKDGGKPEYHMFYATKHPDGAVLMGDLMGGRQIEMERIKDQGQVRLFSDAEEDPAEDIMELIRELKKQGYEEIRLKFFLAFLYMYRDYFNTKSRITSVLKNLEQQGLLSVRREPSMTKRGPSRFWDDKGQNRLWILTK